jgi:hypothetical protein
MITFAIRLVTAGCPGRYVVWHTGACFTAIGRRTLIVKRIAACSAVGNGRDHTLAGEVITVTRIALVGHEYTVIVGFAAGRQDLHIDTTELHVGWIHVAYHVADGHVE